MCFLFNYKKAATLSTTVKLASGESKLSPLVHKQNIVHRKLTRIDCLLFGHVPRTYDSDFLNHMFYARSCIHLLIFPSIADILICLYFTYHDIPLSSDVPLPPNSTPPTKFTFCLVTLAAPRVPFRWPFTCSSL